MGKPAFHGDGAEERARARRKEQVRRMQQRAEADGLRKAVELLRSFPTPVGFDLQKYTQFMLGPDARLPPGSPAVVPVSWMPSPQGELPDLPSVDRAAWAKVFPDDDNPTPPRVLAEPSDASWGQWADLALPVGEAINRNDLGADLDGLLDRGLEAYDADPYTVWSLPTRVIMANTEFRKDREWVRDCALAAVELLKTACKGDRAGLVEKLVRAHRCGLVGPDGIYDWLGWIGTQLVTSLRKSIAGQKPAGMAKRPLRPAVVTSDRLANDRLATPTIYHHGDRSYSLTNMLPIVVTLEEHSVLRAFAETRTALDTKALEERVGNPSRVMAQLVKKFPGAVRLPEHRGDGYFITVQPAPQAPKE